MDYEKKYKEALERARANYKADKEMGFLENCDMLELIFPELAESEDERIRRELIEYLRGDLDDITTDDTDRWIAWLEKQKEPIDPFDTKLFQDGVKEGRRLEREEQGQTKEGVVRDNEFIKFSDGSFIDLRPDLGKMAFDVKDGEKVIVQIRKK